MFVDLTETGAAAHFLPGVPLEEADSILGFVNVLGGVITNASRGTLAALTSPVSTGVASFPVVSADSSEDGGAVVIGSAGRLKEMLVVVGEDLTDTGAAAALKLTVYFATTIGIRSSGDQLARVGGDCCGTTGLSVSSELKLLIRHFVPSSPLIISAISFDMLFESFLIDSWSVPDMRHLVGVVRKLLTARIGRGDKDRPLWSTFITLWIPLF